MRRLTLLLCLLPSLAEAGAWTWPEGKGIAILNAYSYSTDRYFDMQRRRRDQPSFDKLELNPYLEYGLNDRWTLGGTLYLDALTQDDATGDARRNLGLGNSRAFARYQIAKTSRAAFSVEPFVSLPAGYLRSGEPQSGFGNFDAGGYLTAGYNTGWIGPSDFTELRGGYRHRLGALGDQWILEGKYGVNVAPRWWVIPEFSWVEAIGRLDGARRSVAGDNDYDLVRLQLSAVRALNDQWSLQAGGFLHADGRNTGAGGGTLLSLWRRF